MIHLLDVMALMASACLPTADGDGHGGGGGGGGGGGDDVNHDDNVHSLI